MSNVIYLKDKLVDCAENMLEIDDIYDKKENKKTDEFERMQRIRRSLDAINRIMGEIKRGGKQ